MYDNIYFGVTDELNKYTNQIIHRIKKIFSQVLRSIYYYYYRIYQIFHRENEKK